MKKLRIIPAYIWAAICLILIPVTFIKNDALAEKLASLPFMKIHPKYSGGAERIAYEKEGLHISICEPVYDGIKGTSPKGFVQVKIAGINKLPETIHETIDYDLNGEPDFKISVNTVDGVTKLEKLNNHVKSVRVSAKVKDYWLIRVNVLR